MKKVLILSLLCIIFLSSCGKEEDHVSREEYESMVAKIDELESQIRTDESSETQSDKNIDFSKEESEQIEPNVVSENEKVWLRDFSFEYDEKNKIFISLYQDERKWYLSGGGIYEEENLSLLQYEHEVGFFTWIDLLGNEGHSIDLLFTVGEEEYSLIYSNGELTSDTVPLDSWDYGTFLTSKKYADKLNAYREFDDFIHNK